MMSHNSFRSWTAEYTQFDPFSHIAQLTALYRVQGVMMHLIMPLSALHFKHF